MSAMTIAAIAAGCAAWLVSWLAITFALGTASGCSQFFRLLVFVQPYRTITPVVAFAAAASVGVSVSRWMMG